MNDTVTAAPPSTLMSKVDVPERSATAVKEVRILAPLVDAALAVNCKNSTLVSVSVPSVPPVTVVVLPDVLIV